MQRPVSNLPPKVIFSPVNPDGSVIQYFPLVGWRIVKKAT
jgi:hypothetical protein